MPVPPPDPVPEGGGGLPAGGTVGQVVTNTAPGVGDWEDAGSGLLQSATVHLTGTDLLALWATPQVIVPAQANRVIKYVDAFFEFVPGVTGYFNGGDLGAIAYNGSDSMVVASSSGLFPLGAQVHGVFGGAFPPFNEVADTMTQPTLGALVNTALALFGGADEAVLLGPVVTATLAAGGTGYAVNDTGTIDLFNSSATYQVTAVAPITGAVTAFSVTDGGNAAYTTANNPLGTTTTTGIGTGLTVNVTAIPAADGDFYATVYYIIETLH